MLLYNLFLVYMRLKNSELLLINLQLVLNKMTLLSIIILT